MLTRRSKGYLTHVLMLEPRKVCLVSLNGFHATFFHNAFIFAFEQTKSLKADQQAGSFTTMYEAHFDGKIRGGATRYGAVGGVNTRVNSRVSFSTFIGSKKGIL